VPLDRDGGSLTIGYGSGGSPPLFIPSSNSEGLAFLKISLFSRPLNPLSGVQSFRLAPYLPDDFKGPWATMTKQVIHSPPQTPSPRLDSPQPITEFAICKPTSPNVVSNKINASLFKQCPIIHSRNPHVQLHFTTPTARVWITTYHHLLTNGLLDQDLRSSGTDSP
jgi:hypothetical protein